MVSLKRQRYSCVEKRGSTAVMKTFSFVSGPILNIYIYIYITKHRVDCVHM